MPQYFSPGVYVEEVDAGPRPIQGVSTSVTGAIGVTLRGPTKGKPLLVTSFNEFTRKFGGFLPDPDASLKATWDKDGQWWLFSQAVKGFFDNGGQQLYVKRVKAKGASESNAEIGQGVIYEVVRDAKKDGTTVSLRNGLGLNVSSTDKLKFFNGKDGSSRGADVEIKGIETNSNETKILVGKLPFSLSSGDIAYVTAPSATKRLNINAYSPGAWGDGIGITCRPMVGDTLSIRHDEAANPGPAPSTTLVSDSKYVSDKKWEIALTADTGFADKDWLMVGDEKVQLTKDVGGAKSSRYTIAMSSAPSARKKFTIVVEKKTLEFTTGAGGLVAATDVDAALKKEFGTANVKASGDLPAAKMVIDFDTGLGNQTISLEVKSIDLDNGATITAQQTNVGTSGFTVIRPNTSKESAALRANSNVRKLRAASTTSIMAVSGASRLYPEAIVELDNQSGVKEVLIVDQVVNDKVTFKSPPTSPYFEQDKIRIVELEVLAEHSVQGQVLESEQFQFLKVKSDKLDDPMLVNNALNAKSKLVRCDQGPLFTLDNSAIGNLPQARRKNLAGGDDKFASLSVDDFIGVDGGSGNRTGIQSMEDIEDISIVMVPGVWSEPVMADLIRHCEMMRYRVAVMDAPYDADMEAVQSHRAQFDTSHAALYHPWINIRDASRGGDVAIPPSGSLAGIWADVDTRRGVHKAPANEVIKSIVGLTQDINKREQDLLNPRGINALRFFPGRANRVWGARTISSDTNFKYINVRRIFNFIERSIDEGTQFVVFEPNDEKLWHRVFQTIYNFLETQWQAGVLEGTTADEAFYVACERGVTMSQDDIENGRLICEVGIAPVYPAEFVIFRISKYTADSKLA